LIERRSRERDEREYHGPLDLAAYDLVPIYEADFTGLLNSTIIGKEWVLEGTGRAWTEGGTLHVANGKGDEDHVVLWNTRAIPTPD
jgi:hypothetical protein